MLVAARRKWAMEDHYRCPGPIQFADTSAGMDITVPGFLSLTLKYELEAAKAATAAAAPHKHETPLAALSVRPRCAQAVMGPW